MRRYLPRPGRWVAATLIGCLLCLAIIAGGNMAGLGGAGVWDDLLLLALLGAAIGTSEWWILRRHYHEAALWMLGSAAGFLWFAWTIIHPSHTPTELVVWGAVIGALAAVVSGVTLVWLKRRPLAGVSQRTA